MSFHRTSLLPRLSAFRPVGDRVLLRRHSRPTESGGILLPTNASHSDLAKFDIIAAGPRCVSVVPGDIGLAPTQLAFNKIQIDGLPYEVAPESILSAFIPQ